MNINTSNITRKNDVQTNSTKPQNNNSDVKFSEELKDLKETKAPKEEKENKEEVKEEAKVDSKKTESAEEKKDSKQVEDTETEKQDENQNIAEAIDDLNSVLTELNQSEDKKLQSLKDFQKLTDKDNEGEDLINNDFNIDNKDKLPQMMPNMNFGGDGQPFSSFMNNNTDQNGSAGGNLNSSAKELAEEAAILSTMAENVAMANKATLNQAEAVQQPKERIVHQEDGIKKVDTKTNIVKETIVKYDTVVMNEADVEVFTNLVQNGEVNLNNLAPEAAQKSVNVSKTLADMLAKAMEDNKPIRIEFDNGISVIIKVSREGKLTADFLPSTQIAEAYLKENLPLLKQRFDEQNIEYDELNQRERREKQEEQDKKKGRENE